MTHERMFRHEHAHRLDEPERQKWLPADSVVRELGIRPGMRIADVGAGTGYFTLPLARAVAPGGEVLAVDLQPEMLERLRARIEPGLAVTLIAADAIRTTIAGESVDLALLANVWHEIDDRDAAIEEMRRILRANGRIAILDWRADVEQPPGPPLDHRILPADAIASLRAKGWNVEPARSIGTFHYLVVATRA